MCDEPYYTCRSCGTHFYGWSTSDSCSVCGGDLVHDDLFAKEDLEQEEPAPGGAGDGRSCASRSSKTIFGGGNE